MTTPPDASSDSPEIGPAGDGGALARALRRTRRGAPWPAAAALVLAATAWWWPRWADDALRTAVAGAVVVMLAATTPVLVHRAALWRQAMLRRSEWDEGAESEDRGWQRAVCGESMPLFRPKGAGSVLTRRRRFPPRVLPLRSRSGPLADGRAVIVLARSDGECPRTGDGLVVLSLGRRGPYLIGRTADRALFAAHRWSATTP